MSGTTLFSNKSLFYVVTILWLVIMKYYKVIGASNCLAFRVLDSANPYIRYEHANLYINTLYKKYRIIFFHWTYVAVIIIVPITS